MIEVSGPERKIEAFINACKPYGVIEVSGPERKIEAFINACKPYGVKSVARTGTIAMPRQGKAD